MLCQSDLIYIRLMYLRLISIAHHCIEINECEEYEIQMCRNLMLFLLLGERAHLCGLFCDCQELDDTFDRLITRTKVPEKRCEAILEVIEDRLRLPWPRGAIKLPIDR